MRKSWAGALVTSCFMHACLVGAGAWLLSRAFGESLHDVELVPVVDQPRGIELPVAHSLTEANYEAATAKPQGEPDEPMVPSGGLHEARPDLPRAGRGGTRQAATRALNLTDRASEVALTHDTTTFAAHSQIQRLRTSTRRASRDDRRATPNPMQLTFVASGPGTLLERRPASPSDPARGSALGGLASRAGTLTGLPLPDGDATPAAASVGGDPGSEPRDALGVAHGAGDPKFSARVITARPPVTRARAAVPANTRARPNDTIDSSHQVADVVRSLVHAGGLGGPQGPGEGGDPAPGAARGRDGLAGVGARANSSGTRPGPGVGMAADTGFGRYTERLLAQIDWERAFPTWAIARGVGGLTVVALTLDRHGRVRSVSIVRPSGVDEFDANLLTAIRRDGPYGALPAALGDSLTLRIAFDAINPAVGRDGPGPGGRGR